jgi:hypothetical protein
MGRCLGVLALALAVGVQARAAVSPTAGASLQAYCDHVAQLVESGTLKPRFFVDVSDSSKKGSHWHEFKDQGLLDQACKDGGCYQEAWAYSQGGHLVLMAYTFGDASATWANNVDYYFYPNGRVAKNRSEMRRSGATDPASPTAAAFLVEVLRLRLFDEKGSLLKEKAPRYFQVVGEDKVPLAAAKFEDALWPDFRRIQDLPMADLLRPPKPKAQPSPSPGP